MTSGINGSLDTTDQNRHCQYVLHQISSIWTGNLTMVWLLASVKHSKVRHWIKMNQMFYNNQINDTTHFPPARYNLCCSSTLTTVEIADSSRGPRFNIFRADIGEFSKSWYRQVLINTRLAFIFAAHTRNSQQEKTTMSEIKRWKKRSTSGKIDEDTCPQLKSYIGHKAEQLYVYKSLPLGQDRRRRIDGIDTASFVLLHRPKFKWHCWGLQRSSGRPTRLTGAWAEAVEVGGLRRGEERQGGGTEEEG
jgi:hypothetical protein